MKPFALLSMIIIVCIGATGVNLSPMVSGRGDVEIAIVARNMTFVMDSPELSGQTNPTITVQAGQKVTIVLRNDDPGMQHDLLIQGLQVEVEIVSYGETTQLTFTAPGKPGTYIYMCSFHPRSMRGAFIVE